jgi:hypothetical protein
VNNSEYVKGNRDIETRKIQEGVMRLLEMGLVMMIAFVYTAIFGVGIRRQTTWNILLPFFIILFLATWATGIWLTPIGPVFRGVFRSTFIFIGLLYALLLTIFIPSRRLPKSSREKARQVREERETLRVFNLFFWLFITGLIIAIIGRYIMIH